MEVGSAWQMARVAIALAAFFIGAQAHGQYVISAQAGLVNHTEGRVFLNQKRLPRQFGHFRQMADDDVFVTRRGRAEILLAPGVFLRLGEDTSIRMLSDQITDAGIELVSGQVVLETLELKQIKRVTLTLGETSVSTNKRGLYRLEANPAALRVFKGKALVISGNRRVEAKQGREVLLDESLTLRKFDSSRTDALDQWSDRRRRLLELARMKAMWPRRRSGFSRFSADQSAPGISGSDFFRSTTR